MMMRDKVADGKYDDDSLLRITDDFNRMAYNAMTFNMPSDEPYYRMKILYFLGRKILK